MTELRRDPIVGRWVIIDTDKPKAPGDFEREDHTQQHHSSCVFCPGKEHQTPLEVEAIRPNGSRENTEGWTVRVVPNKFPALTSEGNIDRRGLGLFDMSNGIGDHEVVIETPDHFRDLPDLTPDELVNVIRTYKSRSLALAKDERFKYILIFKNYGKSAGASQEHAHSQIIALPMVPKYVLEELEGANAYYEYRGRCVFCDIIYQEFQDKERIVTENEDFIAFCPFTPRFAFESWILPKRHSHSLTDLQESEELPLAKILKEMLYRSKVVLNNPSYNFYLHVAPIEYEHHKSYHWHIEIVPKLTRVAGFEWGTGFYIVPTDPAAAAGHLQGVAAA